MYYLGITVLVNKNDTNIRVNMVDLSSNKGHSIEFDEALEILDCLESSLDFYVTKESYIKYNLCSLMC